MKVISFEIEESKVNKGQMILIAVTETNERFVVAGNAHYCTQLVPYDKCWDAIGQEKFKEITGY